YWSPLAGETEHIAFEHAFALICLYFGASRFGCLRIICQNETGPHDPIITARELLAPNGACNTGDRNNRLGCRTSRNCRQDDAILFPNDVCPLTAVTLPSTPSRFTFQTTHGITNLGPVLQQQFICFDLGLDRMQYIGRELPGRANDHRTFSQSS